MGISPPPATRSEPTQQLQTRIFSVRSTQYVVRSDKPYISPGASRTDPRKPRPWCIRVLHTFTVTHAPHRTGWHARRRFGLWRRLTGDRSRRIYYSVDSAGSINWLVRAWASVVPTSRPTSGAAGDPTAGWGADLRSQPRTDPFLRGRGAAADTLNGSARHQAT